MQCIGRRYDHENLCGHLEKYINPERFQHQKRRAKKKTAKRATRCYFTLGTGLESDCPALRGREKPELYQTHENRDMRRN